MRNIRELAGWGLLILALLAPIAALVMLSAFEDGSAFRLFLGAAVLASVTPRLWLSARHLREPPEEEVAEADGRRPVVLLHRFARVSDPLWARLVPTPALLRELRDGVLERALRRRARTVGPTVSLARPETPARHGPIRPAIETGWAKQLERHLKKAALAVTVADGSEANAFEIERAWAILGPARLVIVVPANLARSRYDALRERFPILPAEPAPVLRFDAMGRPIPAAALAIEPGERVSEPKAPATTLLLAPLAIGAGLVSAVATPLATSDALGAHDDELWLACGAGVIALSVVLAAVSRRALRLVATNDAVLVSLAASPWLLSVAFAPSFADTRFGVARALGIQAVGATYAAPLLAATSVILACSTLVRRAEARRAAFAVFGAAALLPFVPLATSLRDMGVPAFGCLVGLSTAMLGLGLAAWAASGEPARPHAPLPIGAAVAAVMTAGASFTATGSIAWRQVLSLGASGARVDLMEPAVHELARVGAAWPVFALAGPAVVVLVAVQFARRGSTGSVLSFAPLLVAAALSVWLQGRASAAFFAPRAWSLAPTPAAARQGDGSRRGRIRASGASRAGRSDPEDGRAPGVAGAEHGGEDQVALLDLALLAPVVDGQRHRRRGRVAVPHDGVEGLFLRDLGVLDDRLVDPEVGLVRHEPVDLVPGEARLGERVVGRHDHVAHRVEEDLLAAHLRVHVAVGRRVVRVVPDEGQPRDLEDLHVEVPGARAVRLAVREDARPACGSSVSSLPDHHGAGGVAEEHHDVAAARRVLERVAVNLGADEEHLLVLAGADEGVGHLQAVHEPAALLPDVVAGAAALAVDAQLRLQEHARAREVDVGREGARR